MDLKKAEFYEGGWMEGEEREELGFRICDECGAEMDEGYVVGGGELHYCEDCKKKLFTDDEWEQMCEEDEDTYWTEWWDEVCVLKDGVYVPEEGMA